MRKVIAVVAAAVALANPANAVRILIDGQHGQTVRVAYPPDTMVWTDALAPNWTSLGDYNVTYSYNTYPDGRTCGGDPATPPDECHGRLVSMVDAYTAGNDPVQKSIFLPTSTGGTNGLLVFSPTSGARVMIDVDGTALPEPGVWLMMIGGFGAIGVGMRRRKLSRAAA